MNNYFIDSPDELREIFITTECKITQIAEDAYLEVMKLVGDTYKDFSVFKEAFIKGFVESYKATAYINMYNFAAAGHTSIAVITKATGLSESEFLTLAREEFCKRK